MAILDPDQKSFEYYSRVYNCLTRREAKLEDRKKALLQLLKGEQQNINGAIYFLGMAYRRGVEIPKDTNKAKQCFGRVLNIYEITKVKLLTIYLEDNENLEEAERIIRQLNDNPFTMYYKAFYYKRINDQAHFNETITSLLNTPILRPELSQLLCKGFLNPDIFGINFPNAEVFMAKLQDNPKWKRNYYSCYYALEKAKSGAPVETPASYLFDQIPDVSKLSEEIASEKKSSIKKKKPKSNENFEPSMHLDLEDILDNE